MGQLIWKIKLKCRYTSSYITCGGICSSEKGHQLHRMPFHTLSTRISSRNKYNNKDVRTWHKQPILCMV